MKSYETDTDKPSSFNKFRYAMRNLLQILALRILFCTVYLLAIYCMNIPRQGGRPGIFHPFCISLNDLGMQGVYLSRKRVREP